MKLAGIIAAWTVCGIVGAGFLFAYVQEEWADVAEENFREDMGKACLMSLAGPICLIVALAFTGFGKHGWRLWAKAKDNRTA